MSCYIGLITFAESGKYCSVYANSVYIESVSRCVSFSQESLTHGHVDAVAHAFLQDNASGFGQGAFSGAMTSFL